MKPKGYMGLEEPTELTWHNSEQVIVHPNGLVVNKRNGKIYRRKDRELPREDSGGY